MSEKFEHLEAPFAFKQYWSKYPHGYSIYEAMLDWLQTVNLMVDSLNLTNEEIEKLFTDTLPENVETVLNDWYLDGRFVDLINSSLFETKADKEEVTAIEDDLLQRKVNVKTLGVVGDGVTDVTLSLQAIIDTYNHVYFPDGVYLIDPAVGLTINSNQTMEFSKNAWLKNKAHELESYRMLNLSDVSNVKIINPQLDGSKVDNVSVSGEHGHGISLRGTTNILITDGIIKNCWGDGIYVGTAIQGYCENTTIKNTTCDGNRRQGISVTSAKSLLIDGARLLNTGGTAPECGLDIEPNANTSYLENIKIVNLYTENNAIQGVIIALHNMFDSSNLVDIVIQNHTDLGSTNGLAVAKTAGSFEGSIKIINSFYSYSKGQGIQVRDYDISAPCIELINPTIINANVSGSTVNKYGSGIVIFKEVGDDYSTTIGNVKIINPTIVDDRSVLKMVCCIYVANLVDGLGKNISIINPIKITSGLPLYFSSAGHIEDVNQMFRYDPTSGVTLRTSGVYSLITNKNFPSQKTMELDDGLKVGCPEITFTLENAYPILIYPDTLETIYPLGTIAGGWIKGEKIGSSITLKKLSATQWTVTKLVGTWSAQS